MKGLWLMLFFLRAQLHYLVVPSCLVSVFYNTHKDFGKRPTHHDEADCGYRYCLPRVPVTPILLSPIWGRFDLLHFLSHWGLLTERLWFSFGQ